MLDFILGILMGMFIPYIIILFVLDYIGTTLPSLLSLVLIYLGMFVLAALPASVIYRKKKAEKYAREHSGTMKKF